MDNNIDTRYLNGKIYALICDKTNQRYCGSTIRTLTGRLSDHKSKYNKCSSKEIIKNGNFRIVLLELYPCQSLRELQSREQQWIDQGIYINDNRSFISEEDSKEYQKEYYENNSENIKEYQKEYKKEYREINSEKIREQNKEYYENNSEKLNEKCSCDCGGKFTYKNKLRHLKTNKHLDYINNLEN